MIGMLETVRPDQLGRAVTVSSSMLVAVQEEDGPVLSARIADLPFSGGPASGGLDANLFDIIPANRHSAILGRTSTYDCAPDLKTAIDQASAERRELVVPSGQFMVYPDTVIADEDDSYLTFAVARIRSEMNIRGERGATFKIFDGVSTDAIVRSMCIFGTDEVLSGVSWDNLVFDMNGANNKISPNRGSLNYSYLNQSPILVSGTPGAKFNGQIAGNTLTVNVMTSGQLAIGQWLNFAGLVEPRAITGFVSGVGGVGTYTVSGSAVAQAAIAMSSGVAALIDDVLVHRCRFINNPGVCDIVMAQSNTLGTRLGNRWRLKFNDFVNNGTDTSDHTCVFAWADDVQVVGNRFVNEDPFGTVGLTGINTCYEIHGSDHKLTHNTFGQSLRGIWVGNNFTSEIRGSQIKINSFYSVFYGIDFFRDRPTLTKMVDTSIIGNQFNFNDTVIAAIPALNLKVAVQLACSYGVEGVSVEGNRGRKTGNAVSSVFFGAFPGTVAGQTYDDINVNGNRATGFTFGTLTRVNSVNGIGALDYTGNKWRNFSGGGIFAVPCGDGFFPIAGAATLHKSVRIGQGKNIDDRAVPAMQYGHYLDGAFGTLEYRPGLNDQMTVADYFEDGITTAARKGVFVVTAAFDPASLALAASSAIQTVAFPGVTMGNRITATFSIDLAGATITAWVSAANVVSYFFTNTNGANPLDLAAGVVTFTLDRM